MHDRQPTHAEVVKKRRASGLPGWISMMPLVRLASHIPVRAYPWLTHMVARLAIRQDWVRVRQWKLNFAVAVGRAPTDSEVLEGVAYWLRYTASSVRQAHATPQTIQAHVLVSPEDRQRLSRPHENGGVIIALPHIGDVDSAGGWVASQGYRVSSVAEHLAPEEFEYFMKVRQHLGMKIYAHDSRGVAHHLIEDLRSGAVTALVCDRDLTGGGVPVQWPTPNGPVAVTLPAGPAYIARRARANLIVAITHYEGEQTRLEFSDPIPNDYGDDGVRVMTQQLADEFSRLVQLYPTQWHVVQEFFPGVRA